MSTQAELAAEILIVKEQVSKIGVETSVTLQKVADLEAALANQGSVTPELQSAFDALKVQVTVVDDLIPG